MRRVTSGLLGVICLIYLAAAALYAIRTPEWQIPDEPAHYNYIRQIVEDRRIPVIEMGDWDSAYQGLLTSTGFDPQYTAEMKRIEYEDHQPPLYYLLAVPVYRLSDGDLTALRLFSVIMGLGVVLSAFGVVIRLFPEQPPLALGTVAFVAFIPQHLAMLGGVNNDSLAELIVGLTLLAVVVYLKRESAPPPLGQAALLGGLVGLAFLTKSTIYFLAGIVGLAIVFKWRREKWTLGVGLRQVMAYLLPAVLLGGIWWVHNLEVYGGTDFLGLQRHDQVAADQLQTDDYIERDLGSDTGLYRKKFLYTTFHSFWGQFGWMAVPLPTRLYRILLVGVLFALAGSLLYGWREFGSLQAFQKETMLLFCGVILCVLGAYLFYNLKFVQFQGRYLFPALVPLGLWASIGLAGWVNLFAPQFPPLRWAVVGVMLLLAILSLYALETYLVPSLS